MDNSIFRIWILISAAVILGLAGCNLPQDSPSPEATLNISEETDLPLPTATGTPLPPLLPEWTVVSEDSSWVSIDDQVFGPEGALWTTGWGGVIQWDIDTGDYWIFNREDGLPGRKGNKIAADASGGMWVLWDHPTYKGYGISRYFQGSWSHYDTSSGLGHNMVTDMDAGEDGVVWCATPAGVSAFDGVSWRTYTTVDGLPSDRVKIIRVLEDGSVWVQTDAGAASFDGASWTAYDYSLMEWMDVLDITQTADGTVWFATSAYFIYYENGEFNYLVKLEGSRQYEEFALTLDGTLWSRGSRGLAAWKNGEWYIFLEENGLPAYSFTGLLPARDGSLWMTTSRDGLIRAYDWQFGPSGQIQVTLDRYCSSGIGVKESGAFSLEGKSKETCLDERPYPSGGLQVGDGRLVFPTTAGIVVTSEDGISYNLYSVQIPEADPITEPRVYDRVYGADKDIWDYRTDIYQFDGTGWRNLSEENPLLDYVDFSATGPDGRVWVASRNALSVWDGQEWVHWTITDEDGEYKGVNVGALAFDGQDVWVADRERGINKLVGGDLREPAWEPIDLPEWDQENNALGIAYLEVDSTGGLWAAGIYGLPAYYDGDAWKIFPQDQYEKVSISTMVVGPDDSLWVSYRDNTGTDWDQSKLTYEYYFMRYDSSGWHPVGVPEELPRDRVTRLVFAPDGSVWAAYRDHGAVRFDAAGENWEMFNTSNIFADSDLVQEMFLDDQGVMWITLGDGYARFGPPEDGSLD